MITELYTNEGLQGKFGMNLQEAVDYFLSKAKELNLEPVSINQEFFIIKFKPSELNKLRNLANTFSVKYEYNNDPPWEYSLRYEKTPTKGEYLSYY